MDPKANTDPFASIAQPAQADPFASIAQTTGNTPPASSPSMFDRVANFGASVGQGVAQAGLSTVEGASKLLNKIPVVGEALAPSAGVAAMPGFSKAVTDTPNMQKIEQESPTASKIGNVTGQTAESIAEMALGDESLKALDLGTKLMKVSKLAETYEKASPFVRAAIEHGLKGAATFGGETTLKTGDVKEGGKMALVGAATAGASSVAGDLLDKGVGYVKAAKSFKELPAALDKGLSETVSQKAVADGLKATAGTTAAEHLGDSALQYEARAKAGYKLVDNAVNGELQPLQDKIRQTSKAIKINQTLNPELANKLILDKARLEKTLEQTLAAAKANGVPDAEDIIKKADQDYNRFRAQSDLSTRLLQKAGPNGPASPAGLHVWSKQVGTPKIVGGTSRLEQALGPDGAEAVKTLAAQGRSKAEELASQAKVGDKIKISAAVGAAGALGTGGGYTAYRVLSGH